MGRVRTPPCVVWALLAAASVAGCGYEPATPTLHFRLHPKTRASLAESDLAQPGRAAAQLEGALALYFGDPQRPGYLVLDAWIEDERDPNDAWFELSDDAVDAVRAGNGRRFLAQIDWLEEEIERDAQAARVLDVPRPLGAKVPWSRFAGDFEPLVSGEVAFADLHPDSPTPEEADEDWPTFTWGEEAVRFWRSYYPTLAESGELYRTRCLACHGASGAGDGPSGRWVDPPPRDFTAGVFKWTRVEANRRPTRDDLIEVLERGVRGTTMPSFRRYSRGELEGLVDWIRFLSIRGETESLATYFAIEGDAVMPADVERAYATAWSRWDEAPDHAAAVPAAYPMPADDDERRARIERGAELFRGTLANCASCHGANGEGDGEAIWETTDDGERVRRSDHWGHPSTPRNLASRIFRGGDRPADLFRRIKFGIGGTIMPAADASLTDDDVWSLVEFVLSLGGESAGEGDA